MFYFFQSMLLLTASLIFSFTQSFHFFHFIFITFHACWRKTAAPVGLLFSLPLVVMLKGFLGF